MSTLCQPWMFFCAGVTGIDLVCLIILLYYQLIRSRRKFSFKFEKFSVSPVQKPGKSCPVCQLPFEGFVNMEFRCFCYCLVVLAGMSCSCVIASDWPGGYYGLPMANTGCPKDATFDWKRGWIYQDTENNNPKNAQSNSFHLEGRVGTSTVNRSFCMKTQINNDHQRPLWPAGTYCIYQRSNNCPLGFNSGSIFWDDEDDRNGNKEDGTLPKVDLQNSDTKIYFCCRKDGDKTNPIDLPTGSPFYLFPYRRSWSCQQVKWAVATPEWIEYDTEDDQNTDAVSSPAPYVEQGNAGYGNIKIYYCYYTSCQYTLNASAGTIDFPSHSGNYANGQLCSWRITVKSGQFIEVRFTTFHLSDVNDQLIFYDGKDESAPLLATLYGKAKSDMSARTIYSSSSNIFMVFRSNYVDTATGFQALYTALGTAITVPPTTSSTTVEARSTTRAQEATTQPSSRITTKTTTEETKKTNPTEIASSSHNPPSQSSPEPSSLPNANSSKNIGAFKQTCVQQSQSALTSVAIVIPLICLIAVIAMAAYLVYRLRNLREKPSDVSVRYSTESVNNPTYVPSDAVIEARTSSTNVLYEDNKGDIYHEIKPNSEKQATDNPLYQSTDDDKHVYASFA